MTERDAPTDHERYRSQDHTTRITLKALRNKLVVLSARGGAEKSVIAASLAVTLADMGHQVGLLDLDLYGPSVTDMFGLQFGASGSSESCKLPKRYSANLRIASVEDFVTTQNGAFIWDGALTPRTLPTFLTRLNWGRLEYFLVNFPPGPGEEGSRICQNVPGFRAIIVTTFHDVGLTEIRECIRLCRAADVPIIGLIEARTGFFCRRCRAPNYMFDDKVPGGTAKALDLAFLGRIPLDPAIPMVGPRSLPTLVGETEGPVKDVFRTVAAAVLTACESDPHDEGR
jgi:Mrp family chromosome partitioning ATPase